MANAKITDLAFELLHQIMLLVPHRMSRSYPSTTTSRLIGKDWGYPLREESNQLRTLAPLRTTCRAFDAAIQPILFSELTLDCLYTRLDIVEHQLSCFAEDNVSGPWNHYTRKLRIVNLDPCYDKTPSGGGVQYWEEYLSREQREQVGEMKMLIEERLLLGLRRGLPKLESLRWFVRTTDPVEQLVAHFSQLPCLESIELVFWNDKVFPGFPLDAFTNLTKLELFFFHDQEEVRLDNAWVDNARVLFQRLQKAIEASPALEQLALGKRFRYETYTYPELKNWPMFPNDLLLGSGNLRKLALRRFDLAEGFSTIPTTTKFYSTLFTHLPSLTSVDFTGSGYDTQQAIWRALLHSDVVLLTSIRVDYVNDSLIAYISQPKIPLESLTLILERLSLDDDLDWEGNANLARRVYRTVLEVHSGRLRCLDVQASGQTLWGVETASPGEGAGEGSVEHFEPRDAPVLLEETFLFKCQQLRSLGLVIDFQRALTATKMSLIPGAIEKRVTQFLRQMVAHMPQLDTVTIYPPERYSYGSFSDEAREKTREAIQAFTVTEKDRANAHFDVIFEESRYELRRDETSDGIDWAGDKVEETSIGSRWRFVDIDAEWDEEEAEEENREWFNAQARDELPGVF
ncbi:hypothetical protein MD484_g2115, partial [Candolleomyces efflorescens]